MKRVAALVQISVFVVCSVRPLLLAQSEANADGIVQKLVVANEQRAERLRGYRAYRTYKLDYQGIFSGHAEMQVEVSYIAPNQKSFRIVSQSGSRLLVREVLMKLLQSEKEAQQEQNRKQLEINRTNYDFALETTQHTPRGDVYILDLKPRSKSKYVYAGKIWVDANNFAVMRMDGIPAVNPSFWVSNVQVQYEWTPVDGFWLPSKTYSATQVRFGGKAVLNIFYSGYTISGGSAARAHSQSETVVAPEASPVITPPH